MNSALISQLIAMTLDSNRFRPASNVFSSGAIETMSHSNRLKNSLISSGFVRLDAVSGNPASAPRQTDNVHDHYHIQCAHFKRDGSSRSRPVAAPLPLQICTSVHAALTLWSREHLTKEAKSKLILTFHTLCPPQEKL